LYRSGSVSFAESVSLKRAKPIAVSYNTSIVDLYVYAAQDEAQSELCAECRDREISRRGRFAFTFAARLPPSPPLSSHSAVPSLNWVGIILLPSPQLFPIGERIDKSVSLGRKPRANFALQSTTPSDYIKHLSLTVTLSRTGPPLRLPQSTGHAL
jgi:hypothetical protein